MRKTPRPRTIDPELSSKRILRLSREHIRTLTADDLALAVSGCPTGSWPSGGTVQTAGTGAC